jgi:hypothetical protein
MAFRPFRSYWPSTAELAAAQAGLLPVHPTAVTAEAVHSDAAAAAVAVHSRVQLPALAGAAATVSA